MVGKKTLILSTIAAALVLFGFAVVHHFSKPPATVQIKPTAFPTIGPTSAPIEIVLIEDFQCRTCREFSQKIIPKIQAEYIQSGRARFVLVPVSFLSGSQMIANAALEVYKQSPDRFFPYLKEILGSEGVVKKEDLLKIAQRVDGIDIHRLSLCIDNGCHNRELDKNLNWARDIMGAQFRTPALYINGAPGSTYSFEAIQYQINQILGKP
jgi:protein-disulfide isomerase